MGRVGTLVVARVPLDGRTTGDHKGPHSTTQPLPPLRGRSRFPCLFAKNLYLKGRGLPARPHPVGRDQSGPYNSPVFAPTVGEQGLNDHETHNVGQVLRLPSPLNLAYLEFSKRNVDRQLLITAIDFYGNNITRVLVQQGISK